LDAVRNLLYLPAVAQLEWLYHEAFHERDAGTLDLEALAAVAPDLYPDLRFQLHPSARLMTSEFPVLRIWQLNQAAAGDDWAIDLAGGGARLLVLRPEREVTIRPLSAGEYTLLSALESGADLASALAQAERAESGFAVHAALERALRRGVFSGFLVGPERNGQS
jgi:hypothetical protein